MRILILGGYGTFGGRVAQLLADRDDCTFLIAGRNIAAARAFCASFPGPARVEPLALDRAEVTQRLPDLAVDVVVDATGPFQFYGADPYSVPRACIAQGVTYLDLADGAEFAAGIVALDGAARAAGVAVLSGVSSFPVLTAAVCAEATKAMRIERIAAGIAPSPHARMGPNVMRAVLGYAGEPLGLWRDGRAAQAHGLTERRRLTVAPPGAIPLWPLDFALVDVPDLRAIPPLHPGLREIWVGAAPQPGYLLRALVVLARARARFGLPSLVGLARLCLWAQGMLARGEHRGGMVVCVEGHADGLPVQRDWHMIAEGDGGPMVPSMAVEMVIRKMLGGTPPAPGARTGVGALSLADYEAAFARRDVVHGWRGGGAGGTLYRQCLGAAMDRLPDPVIRLHDTLVDRGRGRWRGEAEVRGADNPAGRLVARAFGFPRAAPTVPVTVTFTRDGDAELWERRFSSSLLRSLQLPGTGKRAGLIVERFGPFRFALAVRVSDGRLSLHPRGWSLWRCPLPGFLMPHTDSFETAEGDRFRFHVAIRAPLLGHLVTYRGWLVPDAAGSADA